MKFPAALALLVFAALSVHAAVDPDLMPVRVSGLGLGALPDALKPRLRVRLFLTGDERDAFPDMPPEEKFRVFATNETGALPLGGGGSDLLDLTGETCPWLGADPATLWVEGRVHGASASLVTEVSLDDAVIGRDAIRIRVAPFLVLSNCDVAEKLFYADEGGPLWDAFASDISNAVEGVLPAEKTAHVPFPQDVAELGWSGIGANGSPAVWSMERNGFKELLAAGVGVFTSPAISKMGGNVEATPPTALHPHGRVVVGSNLPEAAKSFLREQEMQTVDGQLVELPLDWLKVGHVDEAMAIVPIPQSPGFKVLTGDLDMALDLLRSEITACKDWLNANEYDYATAEYLEALENAIAPYVALENSERKARVSSGCAGVRSAVSVALGIEKTDIVKIPCLYPLPNVGATGWNDASNLDPNPVNMTVLVSQNGIRRILVPLVKFVVFAEKLGEIFQDLGYSEEEVLFIESAGPRSWFGEVHCATNVKRSRDQ